MMQQRRKIVYLWSIFFLTSCYAKQPSVDLLEKKDGREISVEPFLSYLKISTVEEIEPELTLSLVGKVHLNEENTQLIVSPVSGRVQTITVKRGDVVRPNQPLVEVISPTITEMYHDRHRCLENLAVLKSNLERNKSLLSEGAIAQKDFEVIQAEFEKAQADLYRNTQLMQSLLLPLDKNSSSIWLVARSAGRVVERFVSLGQEVRSDTVDPLLIISDLNQVMITADLYEKDLSFVHVGDPVSVVVPAYPGEIFSTNIASIDDMLNISRRTFQVRCFLGNQDMRLKPEMFAKIEIHIKGEKAIWIPEQAIVLGEDGAKILVINEKNNAVARKIEASSSQSGLRRIYHGLKQGEQIVVQGSIFLQAELER